MASISVAGDTSGSITIAAPNVAGTNTLTLPANTGTVVVTNTSGIASVNGITFPATQSASSDANTLDDYEEGTWTPTFTGSVTAGSCTYNSSFSPRGNYVKVGQLVTVSFFLLTTSTHSGTGVLNISGLPFSISPTTTWNGSGSIGYFATVNASLVFMGLYADSGGTTVNITGTTTASSGVTTLSPAIIQNNTHVIGSFTYRASA